MADNKTKSYYLLKCRWWDKMMVGQDGETWVG